MKETEWCELPQKQLRKKLEEMSDRIELQQYQLNEIVIICKKLLMLNLNIYNYETQEQILYTLCNALAFYNVRDQLELHKMIDYKKNITQGLEEYIDEILYG